MEDERRTSEARRRANAKWKSEKADQIKVLASKEEGKRIREYIEGRGMSITRFMVMAAMDYIERNP